MRLANRGWPVVGQAYYRQKLLRLIHAASSHSKYPSDSTQWRSMFCNETTSAETSLRRARPSSKHQQRDTLKTNAFSSWRQTLARKSTRQGDLGCGEASPDHVRRSVSKVRSPCRLRSRCKRLTHSSSYMTASESADPSYSCVFGPWTNTLVSGPRFKTTQQTMGVRWEGQNGHSPPGNRSKSQKFLENLKPAAWIPIIWFNYCNDRSFAGMTLTLHNSQIHRSGVIQWWACSSLTSAYLPAEAGCETCEQIVLLLAFIA